MATKTVDDFFESGLMPAGMALAQARRQLDAFKNGRYFRTGIAPLDGRIRLVGGEMLLIGGRAASGKTAMGLQILRNILKQQEAAGTHRPIVIFSAEMTAAALMMREAAASNNVSVQSLTLGQASPEEYQAVDTFLKGKETKYLDNLFIDQSPAPTLEHMVEQMSSFDPDNQPALMVFDYMDLAGEFGTNQADRITKISRGLKAIAKKFTIPVIALTQLNREVEKRENKKLFMSDFMHGGEQAADIACGLIRPWLYDELKPKSLVECHIVKYRNGQTGVLNLSFDETTMRFSTAIIVRKELNG